MKTLSFTLIICLLTLISFGQQQEAKKKPKRTDNFIRMQGIRVGMDLTRPLQHLWTVGDRYGTELSFDIELLPNLFPVLETGWEKMKIKQDYVDYSSSGSYTRIGFDYNFLVAEHKKDKDIMFVGLRYGFSLGKQQVSSYQIDSYWGNLTDYFLSQNYNAQWIEGLLGIKGEIIKNLYLGWTIRGKLRMFQKKYDMPPVYFNPGYGKAGNKFNFDFTYSVFYTLPFSLK